MGQAREKLAAGRALLQSEYPGQAVSPAYYAMLYAARAALSESNRSAKTHRGTWDLFQQAFVDSGRFDQELLRQARASQRSREATDYDATQFSAEEARKLVKLGERFLAAVARMLGEESAQEEAPVP
jgi:uncharacterized protein (UPF0332 family)